MPYGTLTVNSTTGGSASGNNSTFIPPLNMTVNATATAGNYFSSWSVTSGTCTILNSSNATTTVSLLNTTACNVQATFGQYGTLTVNSTTGGSAIGNNTTFAPPANQTINAFTATGYVFTNWEITAGNCSVLDASDSSTQIEVLDATPCGVRAYFHTLIISEITPIPQPFVYGNNIGCVFTIVSDSPTANLTIWMQRGDGFIPSQGIRIYYKSPTNATYTYATILPSTLFTPLDYWRCGVNATNAISVTEYSEYYRLDPSAITTTQSGGSAGYTPPSQPPAATATQTVNGTMAAPPPNKSATGDMLFGTMSSVTFKNAAVGGIPTGYFVVLFLFVIWIISLKFKTGDAQYIKYVLLIILIFVTVEMLGIMPSLESVR